MSRESRPMSSLRTGTFDDPPANSTSNSPRSARRRNHPPGTLPATDGVTVPANTSTAAMTSLPPTPASSTRNAYEATYQRRRRSRMPDSPGSHDERDAPPAAKRRKIDSSHYEAWPKPIKYGKYGQEMPGKLRLEIVSCDGGEQQDRQYPNTFLGCQNILRNDRSVYSSSRPGCNIVLRHEDWTSFSLEKLHIVAPEHGFRHPVGYGLVYVAMSLNDLQQYLQSSAPPPPIYAQRQHISPSSPPAQQQAPSQRRPRQVSPADELSLYEALLDPAVNAAHDRSADGEDTVDSTSASLDDFFRRANDIIDGDMSRTQSPEPWAEDDELEEVDAWQPAITVSYDEDIGPEDASSEDVMAFRNHRERLARLHTRRSYYSATQPQHEAAREYLAQQEALERENRRWDQTQRDLMGSNRNISDLSPGSARMLQLERNRHHAVLRQENARFPPVSSSLRPDFSLQPHGTEQSDPRRRINVPAAALVSSHADPEDDRFSILIRQQMYRLRYGGPYTPSPIAPAVPPPSTTTPLQTDLAPPPTATQQPTSQPHPPPRSLPPTVPPSHSPPPPSSSLPSSKVTSAYFTMQEDQRKVTLNFSPEVSGKFILLTLWSDGRGNDGGGGGPLGASSVDVESVVATGYGGMRYFAAQEVR